MEKMEDTSETDNSTPTINKLNDDCLRLIFQYLPIIEKIKVERVCKRWQKLSKESWYTFKRLDLRRATWGWPDECEKKFIDNDILHQVLIRCGQYLNDVDLSRNYNKILLYDVSIKDICVRCQRLKSLNLSDLLSRRGHNCPFHDSEMLIDSLLLTCQNLVKFGLEPCYKGYKEKDLARLFDKMRKIKYFRLGSCHRLLDIKGECLLHLPSDTIEEIVLVQCALIEPSFFCRAFNSFNNLQTLILSNCKNINDYAMQALSFHLKRLKALGITGSCSITEEGMKNIMKLENLEKLSVRYNQSFTDDVLSVVSVNCTQLTFLDIESCNRVTDKGVLSMTFLPHLNHLIMSRTKISDENLGKLKNLKYLVAIDCARLKDDGLCELIQNNPRLEILHLKQCKLVTDKLLVFAMNATKERENDVVLNICTASSGINGRFINTSLLLNVVLTIRLVRIARGMGFQDFFFSEGEDSYQVHEY